MLCKYQSGLQEGVCLADLEGGAISNGILGEAWPDNTAALAVDILFSRCELVDALVLWQFNRLGFAVFKRFFG